MKDLSITAGSTGYPLVPDKALAAAAADAWDRALDLWARHMATAMRRPR